MHNLNIVKAQVSNDNSKMVIKTKLEDNKYQVFSVDISAADQLILPSKSFIEHMRDSTLKAKVFATRTANRYFKSYVTGKPVSELR